MTDTEILDDILEWLKPYALDLKPVAPLSAQYAVRYIERYRKERRISTDDTYTNGTSFSDKTVSDFYKTPGPYQDITKDNQRFWRCAHHPQAIANWAHDKGWYCERGCDTNELRWSDNGTHHTP